MTPVTAYEPLEISTVDIQATTFRERADRCREEAQRLLEVAVRFQIMADAIDDHLNAGLDELADAIRGGK